MYCVVVWWCVWLCWIGCCDRGCGLGVWWFWCWFVCEMCSCVYVVWCVVCCGFWWFCCVWLWLCCLIWLGVCLFLMVCCVLFSVYVWCRFVFWDWVLVCDFVGLLCVVVCVCCVGVCYVVWWCCMNCSCDIWVGLVYWLVVVFDCLGCLFWWFCIWFILFLGSCWLVCDVW